MVDFLKANPFITYEQYRWGLSVPMIRLMSVDSTRVNYLSEKEAKRRKDKYVDGTNFNDLGAPIFGNGSINK
jgi:hypothetical protein